LRLSFVHEGNDEPLGHATAFFWESSGIVYLITNWHVVTGRNYQTGENTHRKGGRPNKAVAALRLQGVGFERTWLPIPLWNRDGKPAWFIHPVHGHKIDVIAFPVRLEEANVVISPINKFDRDPLVIQVGMDVFVLGHPFDPVPPFLPVWKRGSIASEPELAGLTNHYFLADTASRPGMSGAPVIRRSWGVHLTLSGNSIVDRPHSKFLGVYSGRLQTKDLLDAQLGIVWPESVVLEIIDGQLLDPAD
jgi:hypothetical protein